MIRTTLKIEGMMCSMCEAHINDAIRNGFAVSKVTSSHKKGETVILSEKVPDKGALRKAIEETGYKPVSCTEAVCEPERGFRLFGRRA